MKLESVRSIVAALETAGVRYLVAGGLAVAAHGYLRLTKYVDLVLDLASDNIRSAFAALAPLGYRPLVPITAEQFADAHLREAFVREKGMRGLALYSDEHPETPIDIFAF